MDSGLAFEEKAFLSADRLTVWRTNSAVMMLARQLILALCRERCCFKMSENPLEFGMVYVVVKLTLCYVFQRVLFFYRVRRCGRETEKIIGIRTGMGAQHDMRLAKRHLTELYPYKIVIADKGQGLAKTGLQIPKKERGCTRLT